MNFRAFKSPYPVDERYSKKVAYFSMEFAIHQPLKIYSFLEDTGIQFEVTIHEHPVWVKVMYLPPHVFNSAPLFLMTTDIPENDYISQTITHRLYDANVATKVAQFILLGVGGAKLLD